MLVMFHCKGLEHKMDWTYVCLMGEIKDKQMYDYISFTVHIILLLFSPLNTENKKCTL